MFIFLVNSKAWHTLGDGPESCDSLWQGWVREQKLVKNSLAYIFMYNSKMAWGHLRLCTIAVSIIICQEKCVVRQEVNACKPSNSMTCCFWFWWLADALLKQSLCWSFNDKLHWFFSQSFIVGPWNAEYTQSRFCVYRRSMQLLCSYHKLFLVIPSSEVFSYSAVHKYSLRVAVIKLYDVYRVSFWLFIGWHVMSL